MSQLLCMVQLNEKCFVRMIRVIDDALGCQRFKVIVSLGALDFAPAETPAPRAGTERYNSEKQTAERIL